MVVGAVVTLATTILVAAAVIAFGTPIAARLARPPRWRKTLAPATRVREVQAGAGFQPLDLGPDPIRWPSETPWKFSGRDELPWPSQTWDDPHFGKHARDSRAATAARVDAEAATPAPSEPRRAPRPSRPVEASLRDFMASIPDDEAVDVDIPSPEELDALAASLGLAGTVQEIMKRTGWDFKTAAQHLAKSRRGR